MTPNNPSLTLEQAQAVVETKTAPRVTFDGIKAKIKEVRYLFDGTLTICVIEMRSGFKQIGKAAPADERNFDAEVGKTYAYQDAFRGLWALEGYLLCSILTGEVAPVS